MFYKDLIRYGKRLYEEELQYNIHQFIYEYNNEKYILTMKSGEVVNLFKLASK